MRRASIIATSSVEIGLITPVASAGARNVSFRVTGEATPVAGSWSVAPDPMIRPELSLSHSNTAFHSLSRISNL